MTLASTNSLNLSTENVQGMDKKKTIKKESMSDKKLLKYDENYQKKISWVIFTVILIFFSLISITCVALIYNVREGSILTGLDEIATSGAILKQQSIYYYTQNATGQITVPELIAWSKLPAKIIEVENDLLQLRADAKTSWKYCLGYGLFHFFCLLLLCCVVIYQRNTKMVRSRGIHFLIHLLVSCPVCIIFAICLSAIATLQISAFDPIETDLDVFRHAYYSFGVLVIFCGHMLISAMVSRSRIVYLSFDLKHRTNLKKYTYWEIFPIHLLAAAFMSFTLTLYTFADLKHDGTGWKSLTMIIVCVAYVVWILFYTLKAKNMSIEYSDLHINLRCSVLMLIFITTGVLIDNIADTMLDGVIFEFAFITFASIYIFDQFSTIFVFQFKGIDTMSRPTLTQSVQFTKGFNRTSESRQSKHNNIKSVTSIEMIGESKNGESHLDITHSQIGKSYDVYDGPTDV